MATDEEGGEIERLSNIVGALPWPRQMAEEWTPAQLTEQVAAVARGMRALGMNMDLAPVLDTASSTDLIDDENYRSFSENGAVAGEYGTAFLQGLAEGDMIGVVKHFPGLGHANGDTDAGPATDPPLSQLIDDDLVPFKTGHHHRSACRDDEQRDRTHLGIDTGLTQSFGICLSPPVGIQRRDHH